jgi:hypothetical protein
MITLYKAGGRLAELLFAGGAGLGRDTGQAAGVESLDAGKVFMTAEKGIH